MNNKLVIFFFFVFAVFYSLFYFIPTFIVCVPICFFGVICRGEGWKLVFPNSHKVALLAILFAVFLLFTCK
jgi:hypothetical protein